MIVRRLPGDRLNSIGDWLQRVLKLAGASFRKLSAQAKFFNQGAISLDIGFFQIVKHFSA